VAYTWLKQFDKATAARGRTQLLAEQAVKQNPQDAAAESLLALLYARAQRHEAATDRARAALALAPDDAGVLANVAEAYELLGQHQQAVATFQKALQKGYSLDQARTDPDMQTLLADPAFKNPH